MRLLVTGGAGFIGANFICYLISEQPGCSVINLDRLTYAGNLENLKDVEGSTSYEFIRGDICDAGLVEKLNFDGIINFAAESHVDRSIMDATPFLETNIMGTKVLLDAARRRGCRMLHVSTDEVYGSIGSGLFTEESPLRPNSPYAASKASADLVARAYFETYGTDVVITRCSNNYGPYQFPEKLIPLVITNAVESRTIPVYGDGKNVRDWIFVRDHCTAVFRVFQCARSGEVYNIGSRNERENIELIRGLLAAVAEFTGQDLQKLLGLIRFVTDRPGHDRRYAIDPSKVETGLGWTPETSFEEGISRTVSWYLGNREWWSRINTGAYMEYYERQYGKRA